MKNIYSNIYKPTNNNLSKAKITIEKGDVVAVPTETVYGLAAHAYNTKAVKKIFSLKKRPSNNPLIVHFKNIEQIKKEAIINIYEYVDNEQRYKCNMGDLAFVVMASSSTHPLVDE